MGDNLFMRLKVPAHRSSLKCEWTGGNSPFTHADFDILHQPKKWVPVFGQVDGSKRNMYSKQRQLFLICFRCNKLTAIKGKLSAIKFQPFACQIEPAFDLPRIGANSTHPLAKFSIIILATTHGAYEVHDVAIAIGIMIEQPFTK